MKKGIFIFVVLIFLVSLGSCGAPYKKHSEEAADTLKTVDTLKIANTLETEVDDVEPVSLEASEPIPALSDSQDIMTDNVFNNGSCAIYGDRIYFCNSYDGGTLYSIKTDGSDISKLNDDWTQWFNVSGSLIYYQNGSGQICVMNIDGSGQLKLNDDNSGNINVVGDRIYYSNTDDDFKLYSMNIDGSDRKKLNDDNPLYMNVVGDRIYYSGEMNGRDAKGIYSVRTDGSDKIKLSDDYPFKIVVSDGWIYFNNQNDDHKLYVMRTDGSDRHKLIDDYAPRMNVIGDRIYYVKGDEWKTYSVKTDGSERQLLSDDDAEWFGIRDDLIYYTITGAKIYSMNVDGSDKQLLAHLDNDTYQNATYEISARIHESMPEYRFVANGLANGTDIWSMGYVMGLEVYDENNTPILSEDFSELNNDIIIGYPVYNEMMDTMGLHVVDVNFDGYKDVIILNTFAGAHSNTWYDCWLWDVKTSSFIGSDSFADICNPALDLDNQCIYSAGGSGAAYWGGSIYKFIDDEFIVTNELDTGWDGLVEKKLVNGTMEIVREVQYGDDGQILSDEQEYYNNNELWQLDNPRWYWSGGHHADQWLE
ncbi:MAG TPA: DUF5050 domain-containing protein [Mobilitalea sp.]|nr:DUF5050 domain-containing protein [Mobilitalea sp.]